MLSVRENPPVTRRAAVEAMLLKYGSPATLNGTQVRAVIRPLEIQSGADRGLTGRDSGLSYRFTGPAGCGLSEGDALEADGASYSVRRAGTAMLGTEALYDWAVLRELPGAADSEIVLLAADGTVLARAKGYETRTLRDGCEVRSWGEGTPAQIAEGETRYELSLFGVTAEAGEICSGLGEFSVEIRGKTRKTAYSGCRVQNETKTGGKSLEPRRSLLVLAAGKTEEESA
ncbi:hypothetical protein [Caproicibacter fermentans]|uniref:Uncharacterized protein n=1 Tax=Caproicibacter fermentans TaxID=2576756 RepID=A0A7G8T6S3_9FIRM|nr:hypothetical protein [Caproicibacter fermentans]QNK39314.1 hypothetical protein HCR03_11130 [Caproicibacter fermentans]